MDIRFHKGFIRKFNKLSKNDQKRFNERFVIFANDAFDPILKNHTLKGKHSNCRSINITGDLRAIYTVKGETVTFLEIGTHSELYS